jgi:hypothetical protein
MGVGGQRHAPADLPPGKRPGTHCIGGCVGPRAGLDGCGKSGSHRKIIKFHKSTSSGSRLVPCGRTDMRKLIVAFRNFAKTPKNLSNRRCRCCGISCTIHVRPVFLCFHDRLNFLDNF